MLHVQQSATVLITAELIMTSGVPWQMLNTILAVDSESALLCSKAVQYCRRISDPLTTLCDFANRSQNNSFDLWTMDGFLFTCSEILRLIKLNGSELD